MLRLIIITSMAVLTASVGCGTSPEFVDEPEVAATPPAQPQDAAAQPQDGAKPRVEVPPCGMSTRAVRAQARRGRFNGVEGFDSRTCPPAGGSDD